MSERYVLGLDFGTLSVRAAVINTADGSTLGEKVSEYATPVMDRTLVTTGEPLPADFALQVPGDYLVSMTEAVRGALADSGVDPSSVVGIGLDCTSATVVLTDEAGVPMCEREEFAGEPQAYLKLWKHHGATAQARRIVDVARHSSRIAAHIQVRAVVEPAEEFGSVSAHLVLHVDLVFLIA